MLDFIAWMVLVCLYVFAPPLMEHGSVAYSDKLIAWIIVNVYFALCSIFLLIVLWAGLTVMM